jgi:hypothetical protein
MMSEPEKIPLEALIQHHEEAGGGLDQGDIQAVAGLFQQVGNELHTVDHHSVGGNSSIKALQLDKNKVFNVPPRAAAPVQAVQPAPVQAVQPAHDPVQQPAMVPVQQPRPPTVVVPDLEERIKKLEDKFNKVIRLPSKKNINVKFKSEHITAVFDDFEDIVNAVRKSLNKSSKRITIILNEN